VDSQERLGRALTDRYRIEREIGSGGMATVYLAEDLKHHRKVALKVFQPELSAVVGSERFLAEIEVTANLQHPNILPLFDSGEADGLLFYVMPYVEGESLRERLDREKQLPVEEAIQIALDVAEALQAAHERGVIHRDIKPANILLSRGKPLVADFGISLALSTAGGGRITETGLSLGTPHYMSPEQASADRDPSLASDVYSLGCVLYEMLVGEPPFMGTTAQSVFARLLTEEPTRPNQIRKTIPANVDAAVRRALEKLPADRFSSAERFASALKDPAFRHGEEPSGTGETVGGPSFRLSVVTSALAGLLAVALAWTLLRPDPPAPVARYGLAFPPGQELVDEAQPTFDIAPDGDWIVYVGPGEQEGLTTESGDGRLWIKLRDQFEATPLVGTAGARAPSVSPDGRWIAFIAGGELRKIPSAGGPSITLVDSVSTQAKPWPAWLDDGTVAFLDPVNNLSRVSWEGGPSEVLLPVDTLYAVFAAPLPGSRGLLVGRCDALCSSVQQLWVLDLGTGEAQLLVEGTIVGQYLSTGHVLYVRLDGSVFALPFDPASLEVRGEAIPVLDGVKLDGGLAPDIALSKNGTLLMMTGPSVNVPEYLGRSSQEAVWIDRAGRVTPVDPDWGFTSSINPGWSLSPDGTRLAIGLLNAEGEDIWIKELDSGPLTRLTTHPARDNLPAWTLDGESVIFSSISRREEEPSLDLYVKPADGSQPEELLLAEELLLFNVHSSASGNWWVLQCGDYGEVIRGFRPGVDTMTIPLLVGDTLKGGAPHLSPDGQFLAYVSDESGQHEVYVRPFPHVEADRWRVSTDGGISPVWAHSGEELLYLTPDNLMVSAGVETTPSFHVSERRVLFALRPGYWRTPGVRMFDLAPDDQRFLMIRAVQDPLAASVRMILVQNWLEEFKRIVER